jgi:hypothetical protein
MRRVRGTDESVVQVLVQELPEGGHLDFGKRVHPSDGRLCAFLEIYFEAVRSMRRKRTGLRLVEDIREFVIVFGNARQVYRISVSRKASSGIGIGYSNGENSIALNTG